VTVNTEAMPTDDTLLDLLRKDESMTVAELSRAMGVTATAIRQRLSRLMAAGYIDRTSSGGSRGRPTHQYRLTALGRRKTGENFADLAIALWEEIRQVEDPTVRRGLLQRISKRLAGHYGGQIQGGTVTQRMESLARLFAQRRVPLGVEHERGLPVLKAYACPYPELAEQDRSVCAMERMMFAEVLGEDIRLNECRLDGSSCCTFELRESVPAAQPAG
jgi:predicted ArsR family transcriptional regulator